MAISHALTVLGWMELGEDDRPPESIWLEPEQLDHHFTEVRRKWNDRAGGSETVEQGQLVENELTKGLRNGR